MTVISSYGYNKKEGYKRSSAHLNRKERRGVISSMKKGFYTSSKRLCRASHDSKTP
jgi:hypothetical protein